MNGHGLHFMVTRIVYSALFIVQCWHISKGIKETHIINKTLKTIDSIKLLYSIIHNEIDDVFKYKISYCLVCVFFFLLFFFGFYEYIICRWYDMVIYTTYTTHCPILHITLHTTLRVYVNSKQGKRLGSIFWSVYIPLSFVMIYKYCSRIFYFFFFSVCDCVFYMVQ